MERPRDRDWFLEQVLQEQGRLRWFIRGLGVRAEAVDDLAQDALVVAFQKLDAFDPARGHDFGGWVRGIARRLVANALRKQSRQRQILSDHVTEMLLQADPVERHPGVEVTDEPRLEALASCLATLPDHSRQLVHWRYFENLAPAAIAARVGRSANEIRKVLFRIRKLLLGCIEKRLGGEAG